MPERFFRLADDVNVPHRWHLDTPKDRHGHEVDYRQFKLGAPVQIQERLRIPVEIPGQPLDFTEANVGVPLVHVRVASLFAELAPDDVQLLPVDVEGQPDQYLILVASRLIRCIDEQASRFDRWAPEDGMPHKVGKFSIMYELRIDKSTVGSAQVFRCEGWTGPLIVSEAIKVGLEKMGATGTRFEEV
ncbi:MAG: imm11 family protein [Hyalangium sp.]|uniref:imm11 family protein n=1 Tax=Hyalangium sp. TaxID=2028555 RepID=UPI00389AEEB3